MRPPKNFLAALLLAASFAPAQSQDIGLTSSGGPLTVLYGQICGPVACQPFVGGNVAAGQTRDFTHYGAPRSNYAIVLGLPGPCTSLPGLDNRLLLGPPFVPIAAGLTSAPPLVPTRCGQGLAPNTLAIPRTAPIGLVFRVQSFGVSNSGAQGFGPAIDVTIV